MNSGNSGEPVTAVSRAICSVATRGYAPGLLALYRSSLVFALDPIVVMVPDLLPAQAPEFERAMRACLPVDAQSLLKVITLDEVIGDLATQLRFLYTVAELANASKALLHAWLHTHTTHERWLYLDCDMVCVGPLDRAFDALDDCSLLLTAHRASPRPTVDGDLGLLIAGAHNGGFLGVRRSQVAADFITWYANVLASYSYFDVDVDAALRVTPNAVLNCDQRWLDLVPSYFDDVHVSRKRGLNLGHWNVNQDKLLRRDGRMYIGQDLVSVIHLSGWEAEKRGRFSRFVALDWSDCQAWLEVHDWIVRELAMFRPRFDFSYGFDHYRDGQPIPLVHRRVYLRHLLAGHPSLSDPFQMRAAIEAAAASLLPSQA